MRALKIAYQWLPLLVFASTGFWAGFSDSMAMTIAFVASCGLLGWHMYHIVPLLEAPSPTINLEQQMKELQSKVNALMLAQQSNKTAITGRMFG